MKTIVTKTKTSTKPVTKSTVAKAKKSVSNPKPGTLAALDKAFEIARKAGNKIEFINQ